MTKHIKKDPYFAVIFTAKKSNFIDGFEEELEKMTNFAKSQKGFIAFEGVVDSKNEITVSYWETMEDIMAWSVNEQHEEAKKEGKEKWYNSFTVRICEVKREYAFEK